MDLNPWNQYHFMQPLVNAWLAKIELARQAKGHFNDVAEQCTAFFQHAHGFMWEPKFRHRFVKGDLSPRFKMTMQMAFEFVSQYGPMLYWKNPQRQVEPRKRMDIPPVIFGVDPDFQMPPPEQLQQMQQQAPDQFAQVQRQMQAQQMFQQLMRQRGQEETIAWARSDLMEQWLNYTPTEMPDGGLAGHSIASLNEALVTGAGLLLPEAYKMPGSNITLTGCRHRSIHDLLIDPDATGLHDAWWLCLECTDPVWFVEREYGLQNLQPAANYERASSFGERFANPLDQWDRTQGKTHDHITYYKIWSRSGAGHRLSGVASEYHDTFDKVLGDYVYLVIAPHVPFPLNAPTQHVLANTDNTQTARMFEWPIPFHKDGRWPICMLDFWKRVKDNSPGQSAWPIAPLEPGLGELIFLNVMLSHLANRISMSSRDFIVCAQSALKDLKEYIEQGHDLSIIPLREIHGDIGKVVHWMQQPQTNLDVWKIIEAVMSIFRERVGMEPERMGRTPTQDRSATASAMKKEALGIKPDYMAGRVEDWQSEAARMEKMVARWRVEPQDIYWLFGEVEAMLWHQLVTSQPVELTVRETDATVVAGSVKRPSKDRDAANMGQVLPHLLPLLDGHASMTGDTGPLKWLILKWGDAIDMNLDGIEQMGQRVPPPPPEPPPEVMQQQQEQIELQRQQMMTQLQVERVKLEQALVKLRQDEAKSQSMEDTMHSKTVQAVIQQRLKELQAEHQLRIAEQQHDQRLRHAEESHDQSWRHDEETHDQDYRQDAEAFRQQMRQQAQIASARRRAVGARPSGNGSSKPGGQPAAA